MAFHVDVALTYGAAVTATAMNVPTHQTNDILFMWVVVNTNTAPTITTGTGWSAFVAETTNTTNAGYWSWKRATSSSEAISLTTADDFTTSIHCIRGVDTTTAIDVSSQSGSATPTATPASASVTTTTADCFILYLMSVGGVAVAQHANPGVHHITSFDTGGGTDITTTCQGAAWYIQRAAGATPAPTWSASASGVFTRATIAFRNVSGGVIPAYIDDVSSPATVVHPCFNTGALANGSGSSVTVATALTNSSAVNGKTVSYVAAAAQADLGIVPFSNGLSKAAATAAANTLPGFEFTLTGNRNWSTGLLMGSCIGATPKMGTFGMGSVTEGGCVIRIGSSATAWCAYQVAAKDSVPTLETRSVWAIQPGYTGTSYGTPGTAVTTTAVTYFQYLTNQPAFSSNAVLSEVYQVFTQIVAGGTAAAPVDSDGLASIGKSFRLPVIQKSGGYGLLSYAPIQIGGGDAVNFQIDAGSLQFPRRYSTTTKELSFHAADNTVGISYAGKSGDVIRHTNSVITSPTSYYWNINAAATSAATWDFTGLVVVNAAVVLRPVTTFNSMTFSGCGSIDASGCAITNSIISNPPAAGSNFTVTGTTTLSGCTINTTTINAGAPFVQTATPQNISNTIFNGSGTSGHAIQITTPGTYTFTNLTFNSYGGTAGSNLVASSGSTSAAIYNNSGGLVTINVTGGNTPSVRNGAGATTSVVAGSVTVSLVAQLVDGTKIQNANVLVAANSGGPFPWKVTVTITNASTTATVTHTSHGLSSGDKVLIKGASHLANNGVFTITVTNANTYTYTMSSAPGSNPTGTIQSTFVILSGFTDINGSIQMSRVFPSNQPITGWARKSTGAPFYKTAPVSGTVSSTSGASLSALLIPDE